MADADFDKLLKSIQAINTELDRLSKKIVQTDAELLRLNNPKDIDKKGDRLYRLEGALAEKEQQLRALQAQALGAAAKTSINELSRTDIISKARQIAIDVRNAIAQEIQRTNQPLSPGLARQAERYNRGYTLPGSSAGAALRPGESRIPGGATSGYVPQEGLLNKALAEREKQALEQRLASEKNSAAIKLDSAVKVKNAEYKYADSLARLVEEKRRGSFDDIRSDFLKKPKEFDVLSKAEAAEKEELKTLQERIAAEKKYTNALKVAASKGFGIEHLKEVYNRGTDIDRLQFSKKDEYGVKQNLDLYTNNAGKVTPGISNQFRSFGQGVVRDIGELTKWSIALAAVYGPLNKLKELTQEMIANQTKLAEATITVNSSLLSQGQIFDIAADAAKASGEAVGGVIDAFTQAYRAAGGGADQTERLATAQQLLADSLVLSKLSTLDQAQAIDTLAASIRQTGGDFTKTTELLDSWVRVTKVANVDLATLATGFATLGDAAETAGLDANELNGLLAVIAESSNATGQEVANAARAIVGGLQSDKGVKALEDLGIATKDTSLDMRSLQDILIEVNGLIESGVISQTQLASLGSDIGGGVRRGAIVTTVLSNYNRALEVSEESSKAGGDAQAALAKQLGTVQTALTNLNNAFSSLAQTMGTEGGFLGIITQGVDGMTSLVKIFDSLVGVLGKATPLLAAFIATSLLLKARGSGSIQEALGNMQGIPAKGAAGFAGINDRLQAAGKGQSRGLAASPSVGGSAIGLGVAMTLIPAFQNASNKEDRYGNTKAGANIVGGLVGMLTPLGPIVGSIIGTAIAEVFVNKTVAYLTDPTSYNKGPKIGESFTPKLGEGKDEKALQEAEGGLYKSIGRGSESLGKFLTSGAQETAKTLIDEVNEAIKNQDQGALDKAFAKSENLSGNKLLQEAGFTKELAQTAFESRNEDGVQTGKPIEFSPEALVYLLADEGSKKIYDAVLSAIEASSPKEGVTTPFNDSVTSNKKLYGGLLDNIKEGATDRLQDERLKGDIKGTEYARQTTAIAGSDTKALQYYTALGEEFIKVNEGVDDAGEAFQAFNDIIVTGAADSIPEITAIVGEITTLTNLLDDVVTNKDELIRLYGSVDAAQKKLPELRTTGANALGDVYEQTQYNQLKSRVPNVQGDITKPLAPPEIDEIIAKYDTLEKALYEDHLGFTKEQVDILTAGFESWVQVVEDGVGGISFKLMEGFDPQLFQQAMAQAIEEGKIKTQDTNPFGIQQLDMTSQQGAGLQDSINYFSQYLADQFGDTYQQNPEDFGVIFSDYVTDVLHGDNLAVQLALQQLNDKAQKQLDGQYNIPEGATFWVPLTAAYYRPKEQGAGGMGSIDTKPLDDSAGHLDQAATNLSQAADLFKESQMRGAQIAEGMEGRENRNERPADAFVHRYKQIEEGAALNTHEDRYDKMSEIASSRDSVNGTSMAETGSFIETLKNGIMSIFRTLESIPGMDRFGSQGDTGGKMGGSVGGRMPDTSVNNAQSAKIDIKFESTTQLMVDGRILATIIKPYLAADLLKLEGSQGSVTKRYVI